MTPESYKKLLQVPPEENMGDYGFPCFIFVPVWPVPKNSPADIAKEITKDISKQIKKSKIFRVPYKKILGESLTARIHKLRLKGYTSKETINIIKRHPAFISYLNEYPKIQDKVLENLKISVSARYGESKTAERIKEEN